MLFRHIYIITAYILEVNAKSKRMKNMEAIQFYELDASHIRHLRSKFIV